MIRTQFQVALATLISLAVALPARAQAPSPVVDSSAAGAIHGRVVRAAGSAPIAGASVDVTIATDSAAVGHTTTAADGSFRIVGLRPGGYRVRIRAIGFGLRDVRNVVIGSASPDADVGTVSLATRTVELQAVVVTTQKQPVQLAPDRNTYVTRDMPDARGGNALDVLRNVPSVDVDIDNVISLRGNSGVVVQINGRPSPMKAAQLGNFLAQLPADMVEKIEVIPNPSARDDPEGVAGIINIVLKKETDAGTSGGLTLAGGTTGRAEAGGNLGLQRGPLSMYGSYGFMRDNRPREQGVYRENYYVDPMTFLIENGHRAQVPLAHTLTGSAEYKLGKRDDFSAELMYSTRSEAEHSRILYQDLDASHSLTALSDRLSRGTNHEFNLESTLAYKHTFGEQGHDLSSEFRIFRGREGGPSSLTAGPLAFNGSSQGDSARETATGYEHPGESSVKVDYARPLSSFLRMETGYKGSLQRFHTTLDTRVFDASAGAYLPDSTRTSNFTYDQLVNAEYGMLDAQFGKFLLQGGLRAERAATQFHLHTSGSSYDNRYNSLFPSALVAYNVDDEHQVKLSYSTRVRRPDDTDLIDPTLHYQDPLNVSRGNPYLRPEYIRALELGLQRTTDRLTLQLTPFARHTIDAVRTIRTIDTSGVATRTFANVATTDDYGTDATIAMHGGRVSGFAGASAFRQVSNASNLAPGLSAKTFGWTARTNASVHVSKSLDVQTLLFYRGPMTVEQGRNYSFTRFSLAGRQKLMDDRMEVALRVVDPFNTSRQRSITTDPRFYQVSDFTRTSRGLLLTVNWNFGHPPRERRREQGDQGGGDTGP